MKTFSVYHHPVRGYEAVKQGFSWPALFFGLFWMGVKRLWGLAGLWFALLVVLDLIATAQPTEEVQILTAVGYLGWWLIPGCKGNAWRMANLTKRGYELVQVVEAETPDAAIARVARAAQPGSGRQAWS